MGDVDADPVALELLGGDDGRAAAAEGVEDQVALVAGGRDDALEQSEGLLGGRAEAVGARPSYGVALFVLAASCGCLQSDSPVASQGL